MTAALDELRALAHAMLDRCKALEQELRGETPASDTPREPPAEAFAKVAQRRARRRRRG